MRRTDTTAAKVMYVTKARDQQPSAWVQHEDMKRKQGVQFGGKNSLSNTPICPTWKAMKRRARVTDAAVTGMERGLPPSLVAIRCRGSGKPRRP